MTVHTPFVQGIVTIEVQSEKRKGLERLQEDSAFGSLIVNGAHVYRFDNVSTAKLVADNLLKALEGK